VVLQVQKTSAHPSGPFRQVKPFSRGDDYFGPRHTLTVKQLATDSGGHEPFDWQERPSQAADASGSNDETLVQVCYVEAQR